MVALPAEERAHFAEAFCAVMIDRDAPRPMRLPLLDRVIAPYLVATYRKGSAIAARRLARLVAGSVGNHAPWLGATHPEFRPVDLLHEALERDPTDSAARKELIAWLARWLDFAFHEIPCGVLSGMNGASVEDCGQILDGLAELRSLVEAEGASDTWEARLRYWEDHARWYAAYLTDPEGSPNFAHYLETARDR